MKIVGIGEILWDVFEDGERLGGASFNFCAHAHRLGHQVFFVSGLGADERGARAYAEMEKLGLSPRFVQRVPTATGTVTVKLDGNGQPAFHLHRPAAYDVISPSEADFTALAALRPDWIYFGTLHQITPLQRANTARLLDESPSARRFYDINLRPPAYTPELLRDLMGRADAVKLNDSEVIEIGRMFSQGATTIRDFCDCNARQFGWSSVCVTRGASGCSIWMDGAYVECPGYPVRVADSVGAGDAFAAAFLHGLNAGWPAAQIGDFANRVGALVASRAGAIPEWTVDECKALERAAD